LPVFRDNVLAVIGGGDSAAEEALYLTSFGSKVLLIHRRDSLRASAIMQERVLKNPKIECLWNSTVEEFLGSDYLTGIRVKNGLTGSTSEISVQGVFEAIGHVPNTKFLTGQLDLDKSGYVVRRDDSTETSVAGVFAAGDVADGRYRQAVTAAGNGCQAAIDAQRWLQANNFLS
jgi:thioredoxin reductase (NADPH)